MHAVSKSKVKAKLLEYFREVERTGRELVITDHGQPVLKIVPFQASPEGGLEKLRGSVIRYDDPTKPIEDSGWDSLG